MEKCDKPLLCNLGMKQWLVINPETVEKQQDNFFKALELMETKPQLAIKEFKKILIKTNGSHLDAFLHLGFTYNDIGESIIGNAIICKAHQIVANMIPAEFKSNRDKIEWGYLSNRPLLRIIHGFGLELMAEFRFHQAIKEFEFILKVNPSDNQGVRYLIIDCIFQNNEYEKFFDLDILYPDDHSPEFLYGKFLALYNVGNLRKAKVQLKKAIVGFPHVKDELLNNEHIFPSDEFAVHNDGYSYPIGSRQEAYAYWLSTQRFWESSHGVLEFIQSA